MTSGTGTSAERGKQDFAKSGVSGWLLATFGGSPKSGLHSEAYMPQTPWLPQENLGAQGSPNACCSPLCLGCLLRCKEGQRSATTLGHHIVT